MSLDHGYAPALCDVAYTRSQRQFLAFRRQAEAKTQRNLEAIARERRWRFLANLYAHRAQLLEQHALYLLSF